VGILMKKFTVSLCILALTSLVQAVQAQPPLRVVGNVDSEVQLSKQEVRNLFLGGNVGENFLAVELPPSHRTRVLFNTKVVGLTEARIQSYWAQMRFSGRKKPPKQLDSEASVMEYLVNNKGAIAYVSADAPLPEGIKVLYLSE